MGKFIVHFAIVDTGEFEIEADSKFHAEELARHGLSPHEALHREVYVDAFPLFDELVETEEEPVDVPQ